MYGDEICPFDEILNNDVAVCGHIHYPKLEQDYMNSGDFCENSTCLVEDYDGKWQIINLMNPE
jgi:UDP-2,3-diacylglucosamine pyrophosphatase LpxH